MMAAALVGKALLVIREPIIAAYFGASAQTDAYNVAMAIVTMLLSVTISPIGSVLVPVYVERFHRDREEGERFIRQVLTLYLLILSSVLLVAYLVAPWLVRLYAPGFAPETSVLAVRLTRILASFAVVSGLAGYFNMVLTAHQEFLWVALGPIVTAMLVIIALLAAAPQLGIDALAWGMVAGNAVQMLLLGLYTRRQAVRPGLNFHLGEAVQALGKLSVWMLVGRFIGQGNNLIDRNMLSYVSEGSIAALGFARSIYLLPFNIFTTGITRVIIANFSWDVAQGDRDTLKHDLSLAIRMSAFFMIPAAVGLIVLREPIVQVLYQRGAFDQADTEATIAAVIFLAIGLFPRAIVFIYARLFLASQRADWFSLLTLVGLLSHVTIDLIFVPMMEQAGAALGISAGDMIMAGTAFLLATKQGVHLTKQVTDSLIKIGIAGTTMGGLLWSMMQLFYWQAQPIYLLIVMVSMGAGAYLAIGILLRLQELMLVRRLVIQYLSREVQDAG
jgi:putative peptidoglycan lipid II flippase